MLVNQPKLDKGRKVYVNVVRASYKDPSLSGVIITIDNRLVTFYREHVQDASVDPITIAEIASDIALRLQGSGFKDVVQSTIC